MAACGKKGGLNRDQDIRAGGGVSGFERGEYLCKGGLNLQNHPQGADQEAMVYLAVARRTGLLEVVRQCGIADIVASRVPEDVEESGEFMGSWR